MADDNDDLLDPADIEALLNEAGAGGPPPQPPQKSAETTGETAQTPADDDAGDSLSQEELDRLMGEAKQGTASLEKKAAAKSAAQTQTGGVEESDLVDPGEIEKLLNARDSGNESKTKAVSAARAVQTPLSNTEQLLQEAEAGLAAAISADGGGSPSKKRTVGNPKPFTFQEFGKSASTIENVALKTLHDVELDIRIELGRTELLIDEVLQLRDGSVIPLDKLAGDPVDVIVNERLIARGEVLVLNDNFCVRITEILPPHQ